MTELLHKNVPPAENHGIVSWVVADTDALLALSVTEADLNKVAKVSTGETTTYYILASHSPAQWVLLNTTSPVFHYELIYLGVLGPTGPAFLEHLLRVEGPAPEPAVYKTAWGSKYATIELYCRVKFNSAPIEDSCEVPILGITETSGTPHSYVMGPVLEPETGWATLPSSSSAYVEQAPPEGVVGVLTVHKNAEEVPFDGSWYEGNLLFTVEKDSLHSTDDLGMELTVVVDSSALAALGTVDTDIVGFRFMRPGIARSEIRNVNDGGISSPWVIPGPQ